MQSDSQLLFPGLFHRQPDAVRSFLETALQLRDLQQLYVNARSIPGQALSKSLLELLHIELSAAPHDLARIPQKGAVLVVANHPFGLLDGMLLDSLVTRVRPDIKILTNRMIACLPELQDRCLPIDVYAQSPENVSSLRRVMELLRQGHGAAFFPAGEVAHWQTNRRRVTDPEWSSAAIRCARFAGAPIVPVFFSGGNSLGFQIAGVIHPRLRTARLAGELINKQGRTIEVRVGSPIQASELKRFRSLEEATKYVRARTYMSGQRGVMVRRPANVWALPLMKRTEVIAPPLVNESAMRDEVARLGTDGAAIVETDEYLAFAASPGRIPELMNEIGRLREITFRAAGEGSGKALDLDAFDRHYLQLVLWHKSQSCLVGGYRIAWTDDVLPGQGPAGLYTSTLFTFHPSFFRVLGPAVELGRSFVRPEFQKDYAPLAILWQAIARTVAKRPEAPVLFGPVSISAKYSEAARELMVSFVLEHSCRKDLAALVTPRHAFRSRLTSSSDLRTIADQLVSVESLAAPLSDLDEAGSVPVLLRQYLKLGGRVAGFNIDRKFSNALDGLLIVDLRETSDRLLSRYMGPALAREYRHRVLPPCTA